MSRRKSGETDYLNKLTNLKTNKLKSLTFTELESAACFRTSRFLTFNDTRITGYETFCTENFLVFRIDFDQSTGNSQTQGLRLTGKTSATQIYFDIIFLCYFQFVQRLLYYIL